MDPTEASSDNRSPDLFGENTLYCPCRVILEVIAALVKRAAAAREMVVYVDRLDSLK
jgi:hypothetical protein